MVRTDCSTRQSLGMYDVLGAAFAVEVRVLLEQLMVLHQQRLARAGGDLPRATPRNAARGFDGADVFDRQ